MAIAESRWRKLSSDEEEGSMAEAGRTSQSYSEATEGWIDTARKAVKDVTQKATDGSAYVQDQLTDVDATVLDYTGRSLSDWGKDLTALVRERPLAVAALISGVGLVAAKLMRR